MPRKPAQLPQREPLTEAQISAAAYKGSPEHKARGWWGGTPGAFVPEGGEARRPGKQLTTICPLVTEQDRTKATAWVQAALRANQTRFYEGDQTFPKKIWYRDETGQFWCGWCINTVSGEYKGWPSDEDECSAIFGPLD